MAPTSNFNAPFKIGLLLIDSFAMMSYASVVEPLRAANLLSHRELYKISHIPVSGARAISSGGATIAADTHLGESVDFDLVLVVAGGDPLSIDDTRLFQWLRHLSRRKIRLGGVSGGPAILAKAGVMSKKRMTVHWEHARALSEMLPNLMLERTLYVIDRDRITCAGGIAPLDMMHALLTEHHGPDFARAVSDWFMHTEIRPAGGPQRAGLAERYKITSSPMVLAIEAMTNHIADTLSLEQLAHLSNISRRQLNRLFRDNLGKPTMEFYRTLRLEKADNLLRQSALSITEIALLTGFSSSAHFSSQYRNQYGAPPSSSRKQNKWRSLKSS